MQRVNLRGSEICEIRKIILDKTGYMVKSKLVLNQIFRRSSLAAETGEQSNEIFEFYGDQVLSYYVVQIISKRCGVLELLHGYKIRIRENRFTQIKQQLVNNESLARIIDTWDIAKYLLLGKSDIKNNVANETKVKADLLEAVLGAIAVESDWDPAVLEVAVSKMLDMDCVIATMIETDSKVIIHDIDLENAVTKLKELAEKGECRMLQYDFAGPDKIGYDADGNPRWFCTCRIVNEKTGYTRLVESNSKKTAKKAAAYLILCEHFEMQNRYGPNDWCMQWIYQEGKLLPNRSLFTPD